MLKMTLLIKEKEVTLEEILIYLQKKFNKEIIIETIRAKRYQDVDGKYLLGYSTVYIFRDKDNQILEDVGIIPFRNNSDISIVYVGMKDVIKKNVSLTEMSDNVIDRYPIQGLYGVISKADYMDDIINISFENEKMAEELISKEYMKEEVLMPMYLSKEDFVYVTKILQIKKDATSI